jgi:hypothetical protein
MCIKLQMPLYLVLQACKHHADFTWVSLYWQNFLYYLWNSRNGHTILTENSRWKDPKMPAYITIKRINRNSVAPNYNLVDVMEGVDDGVREILTLRQVQSGQWNSPILGHVYVPFISHVITLQKKEFRTWCGIVCQSHGICRHIIQRYMCVFKCFEVSHLVQWLFTTLFRDNL